jgi:hypothetical protein
VLELEGEIAGLVAAAEAAKAAQATAEHELKRLMAHLKETTGSAETIQDQLARLKSENESFTARLEAYRYSLPAMWVALALGVALTAGFLSGLWWLDALIRRRHGGFRVY